MALSTDGSSISAAREELILPEAGWFEFRWREIWAYRDLLFLMVRRDFVARYKQSLLGPLWIVIQPLTTTFLFNLVFGHFGKLPTNGVSGPVFYMGGLVLWNYFVACVGGTSNSLAGNSYLFTKVYFPRLIAPLAGILSQSIPMVLNFLLFIVIDLLFAWRGAIGWPGGWSLAWVPLLVLNTALAGLGVGLVSSALSAQYRDLQYLIGFAMQSLLFITPVIYPLSSVPSAWRWVMALNPMTGVVEGFKAIWFATPFPDSTVLGLGFLVTFLLMGIGLIAFQRMEQTFVDRV